MAWLLRKLANKDAWAEAENSPLWEQEDCPPEALIQVSPDLDGLLTWRVSTQEQIERVVAAQAFMRTSVSDIAYSLIDENDLRAEGIKFENKAEKTIDKELNNLHVNLVRMSGKQAIKLAQLMHARYETRVMAKDQILISAAKYFREGKFDRGYLCKKDSKDLLQDLWKKKQIDLVAPD